MWNKVDWRYTFGYYIGIGWLFYHQRIATAEDGNDDGLTPPITPQPIPQMGDMMIDHCRIYC